MKKNNVQSTYATAEYTVKAPNTPKNPPRATVRRGSDLRSGAKK